MMQHSYIKILGILSVVWMASACQPIGTYQRDQRHFVVNPKNSPFDLKQAYENGDYLKLLGYFEPIIKEGKILDKDSLFLYAESLRLTGKPADALPIYTSLYQQDKHDLSSFEGKALSLIQLGKYDEGERILTSILEQDALRLRTINALGVLYTIKGSLKEATYYYDLAQSLEPEDPVALNNLALSLALSGQGKKSLELFDSALATSGTNESLIKKIKLNKAMAFGLMGQSDNAEILLKQYLSDAQIYNNLGVYAMMRDDASLAKSYLSKALSSMPAYYQNASENMKSLSGINE